MLAVPILFQISQQHLAFRSTRGRWRLTQANTRSFSSVISRAANVQAKHINGPFQADDAPGHVMLIGLLKAIISQY